MASSFRRIIGNLDNSPAILLRSPTTGNRDKAGKSRKKVGNAVQMQNILSGRLKKLATLLGWIHLNLIARIGAVRLKKESLKKVSNS